MATQSASRSYGIADADMLEFSKTERLIFIEDQAAFALKDSNFGTPFEINWLTLIGAAENEPSDEQRKDQLEQLTGTVLQEMTNCRDNFQDTKRYIKKAFPGNEKIWNEFGFDDYKTVNNGQPEMLQFMKRFHSTAVKYTAQLTVPAVNFDQTKIDEIENNK